MRYFGTVWGPVLILIRPSDERDVSPIKPPEAQRLVQEGAKSSENRCLCNLQMA